MRLCGGVTVNFEFYFCLLLALRFFFQFYSEFITMFLIVTSTSSFPHHAFCHLFAHLHHMKWKSVWVRQPLNIGATGSRVRGFWWPHALFYHGGWNMVYMFQDSCYVSLTYSVSYTDNIAAPEADFHQSLAHHKHD